MAPLLLLTTVKSVGNNRGQAAIEAALAIPALMAGFAVVLYLGYHALVYFCAAYHLEEAIVCATQAERRAECEQTLRRQLQSVVLFGEKPVTSLQVNSSQISGRVEIRLYEKIRVEKTLWRSLERNL